jgi:Bacterial tandem repeat domain 1
MAVRWSGVWAGVGFGPSKVHDNMEWEDFNKHNKEYSQQGYTVTRFITYRGDSRKGSPWLFAAIWRAKNKLTAGTWQLMPNTTFPEFQKMYNELGPKGYRLYYINVVEDIVSAIWIKPFIVKVPGK